MPLREPGRTHVGPVTVATKHGDPVVIEGFAGIAHTIDQPLPITDPTSQAQIDASQTIAVGVDGLVNLEGNVDVRTALLPAGAVVGTPLWIDPADNTLKNAAAAGRLKFGMVEALDGAQFAGYSKVNLTQRSAF